MDETRHHPPARRRMDARLDADTRQKVDDLAIHFGRTRAAVLRHIIRWGLDRGAIVIGDQGHVQGPVRHLYVYVDTDLYDAVQKAAAATGGHIAAWLRDMIRRVTMADFPKSWQEARVEARSHDSRRYGTRFMLRLDSISSLTLQRLVERFHVSRAAIIRQLIAQANPEDFPRLCRKFLCGDDMRGVDSVGGGIRRLGHRTVQPP
jgi:predicted transcriptional regulator